MTHGVTGQIKLAAIFNNEKYFLWVARFFRVVYIRGIARMDAPPSDEIAMHKPSLPPPPPGFSWKPGVNGQPMLSGRHHLPDGRAIERSTHTASVPVARRRYCKLQRQIAQAYAAGTLAELLAMRATRSDKGLKRGPRVKQVKESET